MTVEIKVGSQIFGGWKGYRIELGIEQVAGTYDLSVSEKWSGQTTQRQIRTGDFSQILIDAETVIAGYVDDAFPEIADEQHEFRVTGRDTTQDLVDCSAIHKSGQWVNATLDKIVRDICKPFGIKVTVATDIGSAFASFSIQEGETAFECIDRACRMKAVLAVSDAKGGILLTRANNGKPVASLIEGKNIKSARGEFSNKERYSLYIVKGQDRGSDDNLDAPETHAQVRAEATDSGIKRYRPLIVLAESHGPHATYKQRAEWERNVRRGRSQRAVVTVQGHRNASGALWKPNTMVRLTSPSLKVDADLLIVTVVYILDEEGGTRTELHLAGREAFDLIASSKGTKKQKADDDWSLF